jgi:hypothetical protein
VVDGKQLEINSGGGFVTIALVSDRLWEYLRNLNSEC